MSRIFQFQSFDNYGRTTHSQPLEQFCVCSGALEGNVNLFPYRKIEMAGIANLL